MYKKQLSRLMVTEIKRPVKKVTIKNTSSRLLHVRPYLDTGICLPRANLVQPLRDSKPNVNEVNSRLRFISIHPRKA